MDLQQGGHSAQLAFLKMCQQCCSAAAVCYKKKNNDTLFLDEAIEIAAKSPTDYILLMHLVPDITRLCSQLNSFNRVYLAHSTGWQIDLPEQVPVLAVSRHTQAYWGKNAARNPIHFLPNVINPQFHNHTHRRDIDVLVMKRKCSSYVLTQLVPSLQQRCRVDVVDRWVDDIAALMRRSKIFIYDSSEYWQQQGISEGFGLPPIEAMACGCEVFSSLNDALSDYLEPGHNCRQIGVESLNYDTEQVMSALAKWPSIQPEIGFLNSWSPEIVEKKLRHILAQLDDYFTFINQHALSPHSSQPIEKLPWRQRLRITLPF
jgi:glycosyltransferase involved in cell wall biosynthesis